MYPAKFSNVISVSAQSKFKKLYIKTSYNKEVNFVISGEEIKIQGLEYKSKIDSGSSYSSAILSGIIGYILSREKVMDKSNFYSNLLNFRQDPETFIDYKKLIQLI
jgi:hypothetical protein